VDSPEPIPLEEAVARGLIPCGICGAKGAGVRKVGRQNQFLCARCVRRGRTWTWALLGFTVMVVGLGGYLLFHGKTPSPDPAPKGARGQEHPEPWMKETLRLMEMKRYADARVRIQELLEPLPKQPELNLLMGRCLMSLRAYEAALPYLTVAEQGGASFHDEAALRLGLCYKTIGRAAQALRYLEPLSAGDPHVRGELAETYLDLERYDDALKLLPEPSDAGALWARHRILVYQGKGEEAKKLLEGRDPQEAAALLAGQLREEGDFAGGAKALESVTGTRGLKARLSLAVEAGDLAALEAVAPQLPPEDAAFARAIGHLLAGRREAAQAAAWEFLAKTDKEFSPLRLERMMMRRLAGELKDADLEAEAKLVSRFHANDLFWFLALVTGDRAWAERALASTPGHNYPYHAIQRILQR
jgi:thioredoxin-like negative regulator of GroEL